MALGGEGRQRLGMICLLQRSAEDDKASGPWLNLPGTYIREKALHLTLKFFLLRGPAMSGKFLLFIVKEE